MRKGRGPTVKPGKIFQPQTEKNGDTYVITIDWNDSTGARKSTALNLAIVTKDGGDTLLVSKKELVVEAEKAEEN